MIFCSSSVMCFTICEVLSSDAGTSCMNWHFTKLSSKWNLLPSPDRKKQSVEEVLLVHCEQTRKTTTTVSFKLWLWLPHTPSMLWCATVAMFPFEPTWSCPARIKTVGCGSVMETLAACCVCCALLPLPTWCVVHQCNFLLSFVQCPSWCMSILFALSCTSGSLSWAPMLVFGTLLQCGIDPALFHLFASILFCLPVHLGWLLVLVWHQLSDALTTFSTNADTLKWSSNPKHCSPVVTCQPSFRVSVVCVTWMHLLGTGRLSKESWAQGQHAHKQTTSTIVCFMAKELLHMQFMLDKECCVEEPSRQDCDCCTNDWLGWSCEAWI